MIRRSICALGLAVATLSAPAGAATLAIQEMDTNVGSSCNSNAGFTCGMEFTALNDISVTALGAFDASSDGFGDASTPGGVLVSLFDLAGTILASATVTDGDRLAGGSLPGPVTGDWRMVDLAAGVNLTAGTSYVIAAFGVPEPRSLTENTVFSTDIGFVTSRFIAGEGFPELLVPDFGLGDRVAGSANFEYAAVATVPLPSGLILLGTSVLGFSAAACRRNSINSARTRSLRNS